MRAYTESEIIKGCCTYNRLFQEHLYLQYNASFLKICGRYAQSFEDAEQLLQDGFLKIFNNIRYFKKQGSFEGWMKKIIINTCLDYLRSKQFKDKKRLQLIPDFSETQQYKCEATALEKMALDDLTILIQDLPPMSKAAFNLFVIDGYSHKEVSEKLKISEGTSQWHVNNARNILQKKIKQRFGKKAEKDQVYGQ